MADGVRFEVRQMFIENPPPRMNLDGLFATHPPIEKRIAVLEALGGHVPVGPTNETVPPPPSSAAPLPGRPSPWA